MKDLKIIYQEHPLDDVMEFFSNRFRAKIAKSEFFIDQQKNTVVFKLFVEEE
jgi:hypothetical protein